MSSRRDEPNDPNPSPDLSRQSPEIPWRIVRFDGALGATRRVVRQLQQHATRTRDLGDERPVLITPGPRWVLEPHTEPALQSVLNADPGAHAVVGWWRWLDYDISESPQQKQRGATVRVGGISDRGGDDIRAADLLARPMSVGVIMIRAAALSRLEVLRLDQPGDEATVPADAILDAASTWALAVALVGSGGRLATLPRTCSERRRTIAEDPERLTPLGRAWLIQTAMRWMNSGQLCSRVGERGDHADVWSELLERWRVAPLLEDAARGDKGDTTGGNT